jgi:predicted ATPase
LEYKRYLLEEIYVCKKHLGFSYDDIMRMPTYERRFFMVTLQNEVIDADENRSSGAKVTKTGKHTQTRKYSPR